MEEAIREDYYDPHEKKKKAMKLDMGGAEKGGEGRVS